MYEEKKNRRKHRPETVKITRGGGKKKTRLVFRPGTKKHAVSSNLKSLINKTGHPGCIRIESLNHFSVPDLAVFSEKKKKKESLVSSSSAKQQPKR